MRAKGGRWVGICFLGALVFLALGIHGTNRALDSYRTPVSDPGRVGPLPDGRVLRVLSLGFDRLVADFFWLRTVYYIGDRASNEAGFPDLRRLADLVTDIDPEFQTVYVNVNSILTVLSPKPREAIELMEKGIRHIPSYWRLYFLQGYNHYNFLGDFGTAGDLMTKAAELGGPEWLPLLATRLYAHAGQLGTAIAFLAARISEEPSPEAREILEMRLRDLVIHRDLRRIDRAIRDYAEERGRAAGGIEALVAGGYLPEAPLDPEGGAYEIRSGRGWTALAYDPLVMKTTEESE